jgi:hypothetical protein
MPEQDKSGESEKSAATKSDRYFSTGDVHGSGIVIGNQASVIFEVVAAGTLGPLVTAFCTELGRRLGGTVADWSGRMHLRRKANSSATTELVVETGSVSTVIEVGEDLSDEAKLALLDLDVESNGIRGKRLEWDEQVRAWLPKDPAH